MRQSEANVESSPVSVYRWTCPICDASNAGLAPADESPREKARMSLIQHVKGTDGGGHGPANTLPEGFDPDAVDERIVIT